MAPRWGGPVACSPGSAHALAAIVLLSVATAAPNTSPTKVALLPSMSVVSSALKADAVKSARHALMLSEARSHEPNDTDKNEAYSQAVSHIPTHRTQPPGDSSAPGGTACECICGNQVLWTRAVFPGNVKEYKEHECVHDICPRVSIPGLIVRAECTYVSKPEDLAAGTLCQCLCGDKIAWRNRGFQGNVVKRKEAECMKEVCPRVNPLPGIIFRTDCRFDEKLFAPRAHFRPLPLPAHPSARSEAAFRRGGTTSLIFAMCILGFHILIA